MWKKEKQPLNIDKEKIESKYFKKKILDYSKFKEIRMRKINLLKNVNETAS
jgi:hypothetical protein